MNSLTSLSLSFQKDDSVKTYFAMYRWRLKETPLVNCPALRHELGRYLTKWKLLAFIYYYKEDIGAHL